MTGGWINGHWQSDYELETAISSLDHDYNISNITKKYNYFFKNY